MKQTLRPSSRSSRDGVGRHPYSSPTQPSVSSRILPKNNDITSLVVMGKALEDEVVKTSVYSDVAIRPPR
eukprot:scaffold6003_cov145-Skeletonema_menzelii.AAC.2